jgi:hypothetical protein
MSFSIAALLLLQSAPAIPLPAKTDIPEDKGGVVICATDAAAQRMYRDYMVDRSDSTMIDLDMFFAGIKATGCVQTSGPITITRVDQRKKLKDGSYIRFAGLRPDKSPVYGIVNEDDNNRHPRSDLERWLDPRSENGSLTLAAADRRGCVCATPAIARKVVLAIPEKVSKARQLAAFKKAIAANRCATANGTYRITAVHESRWIELGFEAGEDWTALTATNAKGGVIGLVYDGALI